MASDNGYESDAEGNSPVPHLRERKHVKAAKEKASGEVDSPTEVATPAIPGSSSASVRRGDMFDVGFPRIRRLWALSMPPYYDDTVWDKTDVADILHWTKQLLGITLGLLCGILGVQGWPGYALMGGALYGVTSFFLSIAKIPDDVMAGTEAFQEGLMPAVMTFTHPSATCPNGDQGTYRVAFRVDFI